MGLGLDGRVVIPGGVEDVFAYLRHADVFAVEGTFFVAASLLLWQLGYARRWHPAWTWIVAYSFAALGALTKGIQAPVYLVASTTAFLAWRRDWRFVFSRDHFFGILAFIAPTGLTMWYRRSKLSLEKPRLGKRL